VAERRTSATAAAACLILSFCFTAPASGTSFADITRGPAPATQAGADASPLDLQTALRTSQSVIGRQVGEYTLRDREGKPVKLSDYRGKPLLVSFVYTGCFQVCPTTVRFLSKAVKVAQDALGRDKFNVVTIGFNLPFDSPGAMKQFAKQQGITLANWEFLSPEAGTVESLTREFGFSYVATPGGFDHLTQVTIVDSGGTIYRQVYGESFELPVLVAPLKELLTDSRSPAPNLAALVERVRLLCTVYDPASGKYRLNYAVVLEILIGASIFVAVIGFFANEWWRRRRSRDAQPRPGV
jgi:protein SCO1/2